MCPGDELKISKTMLDWVFVGEFNTWISVVATLLCVCICALPNVWRLFWCREWWEECGRHWWHANKRKDFFLCFRATPCGTGLLRQRWASINTLLLVSNLHEENNWSTSLEQSMRLVIPNPDPHEDDPHPHVWSISESPFPFLFEPFIPNG